MDGSKKKTIKKTSLRKSKILDNALLHELSSPATGHLFTAATEAKKNVSVEPEKLSEKKRETLLSDRKAKKPLEYAGSGNGKKVKRIHPPERSESEEKVDVFKIISELEKQLDAAFSLKDIQEKEIQDLKERLEKAEETAQTLQTVLDEVNGALVAQKKLELELEAFEHEQLEMLGEKRALSEELEARSAVIKDLENKIAALAKEDEGWNARICQMEQEISEGNAGTQNLRHQIFALEDERGVLSNKIEALEAELSGVITERDRYKKELGQAKESLDEIRLTLVDTRTRAHGRYYKSKAK